MNKNLLGHPLVLGAIGAVVVIALSSALYYVAGSSVPAAPLETSSTTTASVVASGTVEPAQNPDLAFQSGGRVARLYVAVGDRVSRGQLLASLDTASLLAQRAQAAANRTAQEARLHEMQAGPRDVDVSAKQTAVAVAKLALSNEYQTALNVINDAYGKSFAAIHTDSDTLFNNPNSSNPTLVFTSSDSTNLNILASQRTAVNDIFTTWQQEITTLSSASAQSELENALGNALTNLSTLRAYSNATIAALGSALSTSNFSQASINSALTTAATMRDAISTLIASLQGVQQTLAGDKLAVQSAQNALDQVLAGSTSDGIEAQSAQVQAAQASVANFDAQIGNAQVVAPFAGAVASIHVKLGDIVPANTVAVSLNPGQALQIAVYVSETDVARITMGQNADVTLDAYGTARHFAASVATIDRSPTVRQNIPAYKVTLQFTQDDPAISSGMTANITFAQ